MPDAHEGIERAVDIVLAALNDATYGLNVQIATINAASGDFDIPAVPVIWDVEKEIKSEPPYCFVVGDRTGGPEELRSRDADHTVLIGIVHLALAELDSQLRRSMYRYAQAAIKALFAAEAAGDLGAPLFLANPWQLFEFGKAAEPNVKQGMAEVRVQIGVV